MDREQRGRVIRQLCQENGCSEKIAKIHFAQFVDRGWHPHPPAEFFAWWKYHQDCIHSGVEAKRAYNCQRYRDEFTEAKQYGAA